METKVKEIEKEKEENPTPKQKLFKEYEEISSKLRPQEKTAVQENLEEVNQKKTELTFDQIAEQQYNQEVEFVHNKHRALQTEVNSLIDIPFR